MTSGLDWLLQASIGLGGGAIGAGATVWATRHQIAATVRLSADERRAEQKALRAAREADGRMRELAEMQDMLVAAREELTTNIRLGRSPQSGHAWAPMSNEFLHRLLLSGRVLGGDRIVELADAYLAVVRYNAGATLANSSPTPGVGAATSGLSEAAAAAVMAMEAAVPGAQSLLDALDSQIQALDQIG